MDSFRKSSRYVWVMIGAPPAIGYFTMRHLGWPLAVANGQRRDPIAWCSGLSNRGADEMAPIRVERYRRM
jgi:hypothetical protein